MLFPFHVAKHKNVMLCNLRMTVLIWFRRWCGVFNSFINIIPDQQMEDQAIKRKWTCAILIMLFYFFFLKFAYWKLLCYTSTRQGCWQLRKDRGKSKGLKGNPWYIVEAGTENKFISLFSIYSSTAKLLLYSKKKKTRYPINLDLFLKWGNCDLDFPGRVNQLVSIYWAPIICWAPC